MIYTKKANFPYPVLMNFTDDYNEPEFELDVNIFDNTDNLDEVIYKISDHLLMKYCDVVRGICDAG